MKRRCLNCMKEFDIPEGHENEDNCCPFCGFVENTPPNNSQHLRPGVLLRDRYQIGTVIGAGGFGVTYKAWDNTLESVVAVKEYFPHGLMYRNNNNTVSINSSQEDGYTHGKDRFLNEARSLAKFNSNPGTVIIHNFFEENGTAYIVMEYLDGCNMKQYTKGTDGTIPFNMLSRMTDIVCSVLADVHSVGLIHRDISPDNIFLCKNGLFKLIDFGAVKSSANDSNMSATVILKHGYAPIEQYTKKGKIGPWTDIYSLAATIYKLATGKLPEEAVDRMTEDTIVAMGELCPDFPSNFCQAVMKALSPRKEDRYQSIEEFRTALFENDESGNEPVLVTGSDSNTNPSASDDTIGLSHDKTVSSDDTKSATENTLTEDVSKNTLTEDDFETIALNKDDEDNTVILSENEAEYLSEQVSEHVSKHVSETDTNKYKNISTNVEPAAVSKIEETYHYVPETPMQRVKNALGSMYGRLLITIAMAVLFTIVVSAINTSRHKKAQEAAVAGSSSALDSGNGSGTDKAAGDIFHLEDGFFLVNMDLFGRSYDEITNTIKGAGFGWSLDEPMVWFASSGYKANWIDPSSDYSVGFFFDDSMKLIGMEYNDMSSTSIPAGFYSVIDKKMPIFSKSHKFVRDDYEETNGGSQGMGCSFRLEGNVYCGYSIFPDVYKDDEGTAHQEVKQIYNMSEYYLNQSGHEEKIFEQK